MSFVKVSRSAAMLSEQLLITRIITSLALAVLLLLGLAGFGHGEPADNSDNASATYLVVGDAATDSAPAAPEIISSPGEAVALVCAIGLFCGLVGLLLTRGARHVRTGTLMIRERRQWANRTPAGSSSPSTPSLTTLGISRT